MVFVSASAVLAIQLTLAWVACDCKFTGSINVDVGEVLTVLFCDVGVGRLYLFKLAFTDAWIED